MDRQEILKLIAWIKAYPFNIPGERIMILRDEESDTWGEKGLIWKPDTAKNANRPQRGTILAIGTAVEDKYALECGHRVWFNRYVATEAKIPNSDGEGVPVCFLHPLDIYISWAWQSEEQ